MKKLIGALFILFLANCAVGPTHGAIFTLNTFPGEFNLMNDVKATKTAQGCIHTIILGLASWGDASAGMVAYRNNIKQIATIDHSTLSILSYSDFHIYRNYCTIVSGE
jgi:hypothetical protein